MAELYSYEGHSPKIAEDVFLAPGSCVIGDVEIAPECSIWYNTVVRGDVNYIRIGRRSNIQDNSTIHADSGRSGVKGGTGLPTIVGNYVTVGHNCLLHACTIEDYCLIGMGAVLLDGSVIGKGSVIGAGALVLKEMVIPPFSVVVGSPAKVIQTLDESSIQERMNQAEHYYHLSLENKRCIKL